MAGTWSHWLQDLGGYARTLYEWRTIRRPGMGVDYTAEAYRASVRRTVEALHPPRMRLRVIDVTQETATAKTFRLVRVDGDLPPFRAGQYVNLFVDIQGVVTSRPFSVSSPPGRDYLDLTARGLSSGFVTPYLLAQINVGDSLDSTGPCGSFYHEPLADGSDLVFLAGGSGITPFMSMIRHNAERHWPLRVTLLYGSRNPRDVIFGSELQALAKAYPRFRFELTLSDAPKSYRGRRGLLDHQLLQEVVKDPRGKTFYLCGPNAMYDFCLPELAKFGAPRHKIKRELYGPPADPARQPGWPPHLSPDATFTVQANGRIFPARAGEPLLNTLERHGVIVPVVCRSGECSACRVRLVQGKVFMPPTVGLREADRRFGYIHSCVSFPLSDLVLEC
jgi:ferredoxin-NADP reductase